MRRAVLVALSLVWLAAAGAASAQGFRRAEAAWTWDLPRDHRAHPEFALEWWYLTGRLVTEDGRELGYQATFFRRALAPPSSAATRRSPLAATEMILWHGAVTDVAAGTCALDEIAARGAAGWAGASTAGLDVHVHDRRLREVAPDRWELRALAGGWLLELDVLLDRPPVLHGATPGLSLKGPEPGQASHYVSRVQVRTSGHVTPPGGARVAVSGLSWFDQEFGSGHLAESQVGWDWFSANLGDGSALMIYLLRERGGAVSPTSSGTWVRPDGSFEHLALADVSVRATGTWRSARSGATYPAGWIVEVPRLGVRLEVAPAVADQERGGAATTGPTYWEGLCRITGTHSGHGYVELVGYAGELKRGSGLK